MATPVPVVSIMYFLVSTPPNTFTAVSPAFSAMSLKFASPELTALFAAGTCREGCVADCECAITLTNAATPDGKKTHIHTRARKLTNTSIFIPSLDERPLRNPFLASSDRRYDGRSRTGISLSSPNVASLRNAPVTKYQLPLKTLSPPGIQISSTSHHNGRPHGFPQISVICSQDRPDRSRIRLFTYCASPISTISGHPTIGKRSA